MRFIHNLRLNFVSFFNQNIKESKYIKNKGGRIDKEKTL